jgi:Ca-activated chloride channel family protein
VPFATPLALLGLLFLPAVVAMYLLKLRRTEAVVPSTLLWQRLVADVEANAPWQRLRRSLLLLLQLLLVLLLAFLAGRPFLERPAGLARDLVLVIDDSASMSATDVTPNRLAAARAAALDALRDLPSGGSVAVIAAAHTARVMANPTTDLARVRAAIERIEPTTDSGDLGDALRLADGLARRSADAEVLVVTDAALAKPPTVTVSVPVKVVTVGRDRKNQAIVALAVRTAPSAVTRSVFVSVANLDLVQAKRRLELWGDGRLLEARDVYVDPQARADQSIDDVPRDVSVIEVRLVADTEEEPGDSLVAAGAADQLTVDDRAWAVVPPDRLRRILLVSDGDPYLQTALTYLPNTELYGVKPAEYGPATHVEKFDLVIFENTLPATLPSRPILAIAPPQSSDLGDVTGKLGDPGIGVLDPEEPVLRYVDLSTTHISEAVKLAAPSWARTIIPGSGGSPLLYSGTRAGLPAAVLAFEPRRSDLPLQVAFPILLSNLAGELMGGSSAPSDVLAPGTPVSLALPAGATGMRVTRPDGTSIDLPGGTSAATAVTFTGTNQLGVYSASALGLPDPGASGGAATSPVGSGGAASPIGSASPSAAAAASASGSQSPGATAPPVDPAAPIRFAVDLFDIDESNIAPGSGDAIAALGAAPASPGASAVPGASGGPAATADRPPARDEVWGPILLLVLLGLAIEWAVYERDALIRWRRVVAGRLGRRRTASDQRSASDPRSAGGG